MAIRGDQLSPKQWNFTQNYHVLGVDPNCRDAVAESAKRAGYSVNSAYMQGSRLLQMPKIQAELERLRAAVAQRHKIDQDFFIRELLENHRLAREGSPILARDGKPIMRPTLSIDGEPIEGEERPLMKRDIGGSNRALELLGKFTGELVEKKDVTNRTPSLDDMSEEDLAAERAKLDKEIARLKKEQSTDDDAPNLRVVGDDE